MSQRKPTKLAITASLMLGCECTPLSTRVEQLRKKLRSVIAVFSEGPAEGPIDNIVQFFNFRNR